MFSTPELGGTPVSPEQDPRKPITVSALNGIAKRLIEEGLPPLWISGEISGWKKYGSGHCYFALKDAAAQVRCVMFKGSAMQLPTEPHDGMQVLALASPSLYEARGEFQLVVRRIEGIGKDGLWRLAFEKLKTKLLEEGLLDPNRKRPIPLAPKVIGVVTSGSGAAFQDILKVLRQRAPWVRVVLSHSRVQGEGASAEIAAAIDRINHAPVRPDVLIVGRGGGSLEDLWAFNEEPVARAIGRSGIPVISAVGHETDTTISDLVADLRAPTPSAAAAAATGIDLATLEFQLPNALDKMIASLRRQTERNREQVQLKFGSMEQAIKRILQDRALQLDRSVALLEALSPLAALRRGFAIPLDPEGKLLRKPEDFVVGDAFEMRIDGGWIEARIDAVHSTEPEG